METEDGVLIQWLQLYEFNDDLAFSVLKALTQHFVTPDFWEDAVLLLEGRPD